MSNPTSQKLTFLELIVKYKIEIPIIQRDYAQGRKGKEELRKNFLGALHNAITNEVPLELDFVYGSVKDEVLQPLDGQQRLTTLFLLHYYIATKENKLGKVKELLTKFTYETRSSSREFCYELVNKGIGMNDILNPSELIIDSSWFFLSWKKDPTIKSMLTMLDSIHQEFQNGTDLWDKLNNISFQYIELENFGLSDDLYIKMNARGKALTEFENFKAKFEQYISGNEWESETKTTDTFSHKIDTTWTDLFWKYRNNENLFDDSFLNFFRTMAVINYALIGDIKSDKFRIDLDLLRDNTKEISFNQYVELGCIDLEYFQIIKAVLDQLSHNDNPKIFLKAYVNEKTLFKGTIQNDFGYADLVIMFSLYKYLALEEKVITENLTNWIRIIRNLVEGTRPYLFNNTTEFANSLRSVNELLKYRNSIVEHFANSQLVNLSGFIGEQLNEEKQKAKLILQSEEWKKAIIEIENHKYFNGQIGFLLDWCKEEDKPNLDLFKKYAEKSEAIFGDIGLNNFDNYLFERALLATGDYLLKKGQNYSFLVDKDRDISWKRLLRDNNDKRKVLKSLFDSINTTYLNQDLRTVIGNFNDKGDWRYHFIKHPEIFKQCDKNKLIRWIDEKDILLLGSSTTAGYHSEYYSYSLYLDLKGKIDNAKYNPQQGKENPKTFTFVKNKEYAVSFEQGKYRIAGIDPVPVFDNQNEVVDFLEKLLKS
ncbi:MAG: DUF262 domain-containing protein [bacterium]|nr:DUF262 domain-containing protein [bacterium]